MFQGTGSDVGKSLLVAGLARAFSRRGLSVRPFKPQNMSNNAAVTADGGEIGRAQALQARACGLAPHTDMNPVLLKPQSEVGAQVVVQGKVIGSATAREYWSLKPKLMPAVLESFHRLGEDADLILVEGAGSASEVNLRAGDIANMGFAEAADLPVILIGDIDRGGVIASLVGTAAVLPAAERARIKGFVINKFRGDVSLFDEGLDLIAEKTGFEALGVIPFLDAARRLPAEDSVQLSVSSADTAASGDVIVAVPVLSRISNFDDLDPLIAEPGVSVVFVQPGQALPGNANLVVLPGSKATLADLAFFRAQGWDIDLQAHYRRGGHILGLCGGYQMLGRQISDPQGIEGAVGGAEGLGMLDVDTVLSDDKTLVAVEGLELASRQALNGYEMHIGITTGPGTQVPMIELGGRAEGAVSADGRIAGCYLHGIFSADGYRQSLLARLGRSGASGLDYEQGVEEALDALSEHLTVHLDLERILEIARGR
ncbi:cobyric acid synthase [Denitrobaculum tricleocarpae]|uniref:Cobyric acid synthase n=1 Tax=Denitrobaculum tricleocarpae TaxID=2591009 RepID=A0A545TQ81_9PROT|nr:cobyric acid synthase [Denitrobaculum tricleocarpae]TQV79380.1 cobyric acid synthase [Denitrobaculum tricleocarpae]